MPLICDNIRISRLREEKKHTHMEYDVFKCVFMSKHLFLASEAYKAVLQKSREIGKSWPKMAKKDQNGPF